MGHKYSLPESITQAITISQWVNEGGLAHRDITMMMVGGIVLAINKYSGRSTV